MASAPLRQSTREAELLVLDQLGSRTQKLGPSSKEHSRTLLAEAEAIAHRDRTRVSEKLAEHWKLFPLLLVLSLLGFVTTASLGALLYWVSRGNAHARITSLYRGLTSVDRLTAVGTLAAGVAHEVGNPLAIVKTKLAALRSDASLNEQAKTRLLDDALLGTERIQAVVANLQYYSEDSDDLGEAVELLDCIESVMRRFDTRAYSTRVRIKVSPNLLVRGNGRRIAQMMHNLVANAIEALKHQHLRPRSLRICAQRCAGGVEITVSDNGLGMPDYVRERAFEPFATTKPVGMGTGLGLFVAHSTVTQLGGTIAIQTCSKGTTVLMRIPSANVTPSFSATAHGPTEELRLLIIDDEPMLAGALAQLLREYAVDTACNPIDALRKLIECDYDLVLCDVRMPQMNGLELFDHACKRKPELKDRFIFMTGGTSDPELKRKLRELANRCLNKPFRTPVLRSTLKEALEARLPS